MRINLIKKTPNRQKNSTNLRSGKNDHFAKTIVWDFLCLSLLISFKGENSKGYDTSCRTCMVFQARAMRGTPAECANVFAHSICKFQGTDRKHEMRHERSELKWVVIVNVFK